MRQREFLGPKIPQGLLQEIGGSEEPRRKGQNRQAAVGRKARRRAERVQKKHDRQKAKPGPRRSTSRVQESESEDETEDEAPPPSPARKPQTSSSTKPLKSILKPAKPVLNAESEEETETEDLPKQSKLPGSVQKRLAEDDAEIAALEKKLGIKGKKRQGTTDEDDLDFILEGIGEDSGSESGTVSKRKRPEDEDWLASKRRKASQKEEKRIPKAAEPTFAEDDDLNEDAFDSEGEGDGADSSDADPIADESHEIEDDGDSDLEGFDSEASEASEEKPQKRVRENPYVAPQSSTASPAKYIPPSLRAPSSSDAESLTRLRRQIQGLMNRLSEANILSILRDIESIYQTNPRQYVTSTLIDLLVGLVSDRTSLNDTFLILHAGFVAAIYKVIGTDFGAQFVEKLVLEFDKFYASASDTSDAGKEPSNLMSLIAELYNFQVTGSILIFDYLRKFLEKLTDLNTELILRMVKLAGHQLRQDDPLALKDIVILLQKAVAEIGEENLPVRTKFMVETINNLKNNRMKTGVAASTITSEHTVKMKKTLGSLNTKSVKASEPLRIGLKDIQNTEKRGKWWLVGASWKGKDEQHNGSSFESAKREVSVDDNEHELGGTTDLLELAKEQGMNTDIRRAIFITIMSAEDYKDAYDRLLKLNLKKSQEQEIPRVLIQCAGGVQTYNHYYTLIARKTCSSHSLRKAFQFSLWDIFKRLTSSEDEESFGSVDEDAMDMRKIVNLARMFGNLITEGGLPITTLKTVEFPYLEPKLNSFVEALLVTIIVQTQKKSPGTKGLKALLEIFHGLENTPDLARGLQYFLEKVVRKGDIVTQKSEKKALRNGCDAVGDFLTERELAVGTTSAT